MREPLDELELLLDEVAEKPVDLIEVYRERVEQTLAELELVISYVRSLRPEKGEKGDTGEQGPVGPTGPAGMDGEDGKTPSQEALLALIRPLIPKVRDGKDGAKGPMGARGADADPAAVVPLVLSQLNLNKDDITQEVITLIKDKKLLSKAHIKGLDEEISSYRNQLALKQAGQHGGGDTVEAGTNITITATTDGKKRIDATGGVGTWSTPPETPDGTTTVFTVTAEPTDVVADGIQMFDGVGYTYAALQITFTNAPSLYVRYR